MITGMHHVQMKCRTQEELDRVRHFYVDVLGLKIRREWPGGMMIDTGNCLIEVFANAEEDLPQGVIRHIALLTDDVDAVTEKIRAAGFEITIEAADLVIPSTPEFPIRRSFCRGPLGEDIELFYER